jgi:hypothetical protein
MQEVSLSKPIIAINYVQMKDSEMGRLCRNCEKEEEEYIEFWSEKL